MIPSATAGAVPVLPDNHPSKNPKDVSPDPSFKEHVPNNVPIDPNYKPKSINESGKSIQF